MRRLLRTSGADDFIETVEFGKSIEVPSREMVETYGRHISRAGTLAIMLALANTQSTLAGEGASSSYFPGTYGDYAVATAPSQGWTYVNYNLFYSADVDRAVLQSRLNAGLDTFAYINMSALIYAFEEPVLGMQFAIGGFVQIGYADLDTTVTGPFGAFATDDSETDLGDITLLPASFYWNSGNWHFNLYELVVTPTGQYDVDNNVNLGRNYWSFDTVFAVTNLNMETGREFSLVSGYMLNGENDDTDYQTGNELHVDAMFNQFLSDHFAIGLHGYYYKQLQGDSGSGAILGDFKGESYGIGPSFLWIPKSTGGKFSVIGSWLHDLHASNRLESDYAVVTLAWQLGNEN